MTRQVLTIGALICILVTGLCCTQPTTHPEKYRNRFYQHEEKFTTLVALLQADSLTHNHRGRTLFWKAFANPTKRLLQELGITHVHIYSWTQQGVHMELRTNWRPSWPVHLYYNTYKEPPDPISHYRVETDCGELWPLKTHWVLRLKIRCPGNAKASTG